MDIRKRYTGEGEAVMSLNKLSQDLNESLRGRTGEDFVDVVVEIAGRPPMESPSTSRAQRIAARKEAFERRVAPVAEQIRQLGGEVSGQAWINCSVRARVPKRGLASLSESAEVSRIDLPHKIEAEA